MALVTVERKVTRVTVCTVPMTIQPGDPRWIGCWWLGFLLVAAGILLTSVMLWFFPATMTGHRQHHRSSLKEDNVTAPDSDKKTTFRSMMTQIKGIWTTQLHNLICSLESRVISGNISGSLGQFVRRWIFSCFKRDACSRDLLVDSWSEFWYNFVLVDVAEFPQRLLHLLRNTAYMFVVCGYVCNTYAIMGVFANMVRYLEIVFRQQASVANVIQGLLQLNCLTL